jgi:hypothetical protein
MQNTSQQDLLQHVSLALPIFHAYGHKASCQVWSLYLCIFFAMYCGRLSSRASIFVVYIANKRHNSYNWLIHTVTISDTVRINHTQFFLTVSLIIAADYGKNTGVAYPPSCGRHIQCIVIVWWSYVSNLYASNLYANVYNKYYVNINKA